MGKEFVQGINDTTIYAEKSFYRNFTDPGKKFVLILHYNGNNSYLFVYISMILWQEYVFLISLKT